ncbi:MAG TPA: Ig-like domain-containing protein [Gemmatimonadales bacterium]
MSVEGRRRGVVWTLLGTFVAGVAGVACGDGPVSVGAVNVSPASVTLELGQLTDLSATVLDEAGTPRTAAGIVWASNDPRVVTVTEDGTLHAVGAGSTTVTAESGGMNTEVHVAVSVAFAALSAGLFQTCGLTPDGPATCWGINGAGELGDSTIANSPRPVLVGIDVVFSTVHAGGSHSCGLTAQGRAWCWGANWSAQLGMGTIDRLPHASPMPVAGLLTFTRLWTGDRHACAMTDGGAAFCWGGDLSGQIGDGPTADFCEEIGERCGTVPRPVATSTAFVSATTGTEHSCALSQTGTVECWGLNRNGQLGDGTKVSSTVPVQVAGGVSFSSVVAGGYHTCGLDTQGRPYCWGDNTVGQLGVPTVATPSAAAPRLVDGGLTLASLVVGGGHSCGLGPDGVAYCWGLNQFGELGIGSTMGVDYPAAVATDLRFTAIVAGWTHTCAIATDGVAYCWGRNNAGQLGVGVFGGIRTTPTKIIGQD